MSLGFNKLDDIEKLRGCYFTTKEDSSIFVEPITPLDPKTESRDISKRQWMLDEDYQGFSLAPKHLLEPYKADKAEHPKQYGPF